MKEIKLASGSILKIGVVPFEDARGLYQLLLGELKNIKLNTRDELANVLKDAFCAGFASKAVEAQLWVCFKKCLYCNKQGVELKIDKDTFEPMDAREDYIEVCTATMTEVIAPFSKGLYASFQTLFEKADGVLS
jgi:hypothetical protein